jgi:hypothetical protein
MLFPDKMKLREKLNNNVISLNRVVQEQEEKMFDLSESYTINHIVETKEMASTYEYSCIPSKTSFLQNNIVKNSSEYCYELYNNKIPDNNMICKSVIYTINNEGDMPFLLYLLKNDENENQYDLMNSFYIKLHSIQQTIISMETQLDLKLEYSGFITFNNVNYIFLNSVDKFKDINGHVWASTSEIINYENVYNIKIKKYINHLFLNNSQMINVYNPQKSSIYETPSVYYCLIDKSEEDKPVYYTNYDSILKLIDNIDEIDKSNYYISRRAIFTGIITFMNDNKQFNGYHSVYDLYFPNKNDVYVFIKIKLEKQCLELSRLNLN